MPSRFVRLAALVATLAAAGIAAAAPAQPPAQAPAPARQAALKVVARYDLSITVDANRPSEAVSRVKAAKGAMALLGGSIAAGTIEDVVSIGDEAYTISSTGKAERILATLLGGDTLLRRSEGAVGGGYMASQRFSESRGTKRRLGVNTDYPKRIAIFYKNGKESKVETVNYRIADSASMPYLFLRQPLPLTAMTIAATDGLAIREFIMKVSDEVVQVGKAQVAAVHLTRDQRKGDDASLDLWVRKEDGMPLRFRVGLDDKYGVVLEQKLRELPPVVK
ncbi:MAG: hypothetical protein IPL03_09180 [Sterolibacteriaceae bacterium]|nr:hypothetical protein [Candidatus Methylophosphatis haderslevensis]